MVYDPKKNGESIGVMSKVLLEFSCACADITSLMYEYLQHNRGSPKTGNEKQLPVLADITFRIQS